MNLPRSTYYQAASSGRPEDADVLAAVVAITDEFELYGYRRVTAELHARGRTVNAKKVRRLMRENGLNPRYRRRFVAATDSDHDGPFSPNLAKDMTIDGPNQLWVVDITYVTILVGFVYLAVILDAWSRKVVGYALSRRIDARLAVAALKAAIQARDPPKGLCTTRIADRNTRPSPTESCCGRVASSARWGGAAVRTTTPRPKAS
jgi:putative transposase